MLKECSNCGFCKTSCPVFKVLLDETVSARGRAWLIKKEVLAKNVFYQCSLCGMCEKKCPAGIKLCDEIIKVRKKLVKKKGETEANKKMMEKVRKYGNPFGKVEKGKVPKELYCC